MDCRSSCAACCIAPSISSSMPKHPQGKLAGIACLHLDANLGCELFGKTDRPKVCSNLQPSQEMCGNCRQDAMYYLTELETLTNP